MWCPSLMMNSSSTGIWTYQCLPQHLSGIQDLFWISFHTSCSCCLSWHTVYMTGVHRVNGLDPPKLPHTLNNWMARAAGCRFINKWHISSARCFSGHSGTIFSESDFTEAASANVQLNNKLTASQYLCRGLLVQTELGIYAQGERCWMGVRTIISPRLY